MEERKVGTGQREIRKGYLVALLEFEANIRDMVAYFVVYGFLCQ